MPASKRQPRKTKTKARAKEKAKMTASHPNDADESSQTLIAKEKAVPVILQSFETGTALSEGHCIIRKLEDGRYEILNLTTASPETFGSEAVGRLMLADETGGRIKALEDAEKSWKESEKKIGQVLSSANLKIFRFLKLPLELRLIIYDLTVRAKNPLHIGSWEYGQASILPGLKLRSTCQQIYQETSGIFWRNSFRLDICKKTTPLIPKLTDNIQEVTWSWWGFKIKDPTTLRVFQEFKRLRIFHIQMTQYCVDSPTRPGSSRQYLHQDEPSIAKFNKTNGFDVLISMRGLELVTVTSLDNENCKIKPEHASDAEIRTFEAFVNKELTQPRESKEVNASVSTTAEKAKEKGTRGSAKRLRATARDPTVTAA